MTTALLITFFLRCLKVSLPWENGPKEPTAPEVIAAFRIDSPAWDTSRTQAERVRDLMSVGGFIPMSADYRSILAELVAGYQATNVTPVSLETIEARLFGRDGADVHPLAWVAALSEQPVELNQIEFVLVYGAFELLLPAAASLTRRPPPPWSPNGW